MAFRRYGKWQNRVYGGFNSRRRRFGRRMRSGYRAGGGSVIFGLGGAVAGYMAPRVVPYQDLALTALAVIPGVLPVGKTIPWQLRRFASGYVIGSMVKHFTAGTTQSTAGTDFV